MTYKLSFELVEQAEELVMGGFTQEQISELLGISRMTWNRWLKDGKRIYSGEKSHLYKHSESNQLLLKHLYISIEKAKKITNNADLVKYLIDNKIEKRNWRAAAFILEKRFPERWTKEGEKSNV